MKTENMLVGIKVGSGIVSILAMCKVVNNIRRRQKTQKAPISLIAYIDFYLFFKSNQELPSIYFDYIDILKTINNKFYIGSTTDIVKRLHQHESGYVNATRYLRPLKLEFFQEYDNFNLARKVEYKLKKLKRKDFIEKIIKDGLIKLGR